MNNRSNGRAESCITQTDGSALVSRGNETWADLADSAWQDLKQVSLKGLRGATGGSFSGMEESLLVDASTIYESPQQTVTKPDANKPARGHGDGPDAHRDGGKQSFLPAGKGVLHEREHLCKLESKLPEKDRQKFENDMARFEQRAARQGLSPTEVERTYQRIARLLEAKEGKVSPELRVQLAEQAMHQLGEPMSISQGSHDTCNVTTVENRVYRNSPAAAAKLVTDIALTGEYTTQTGTKVVLDKNSLTPDQEARNNPPGDGKRSFASQLFQVTAVNLYYAKRDENDNPAASSDLGYTQNPNYPKGGTTGERLYHTRTNKDVVDSRNQPVNSPWITTWGCRIFAIASPARRSPDWSWLTPSTTNHTSPVTSASAQSRSSNKS